MSDLRIVMNAISDIIANRPSPIREFDQIYMKAADMFFQADLCSKWYKDMDVVFIGDGDALALSLVYLNASGLLESGPKSVKVLDFDERIVNSINRFANRNDLGHIISASLYNVAEAMSHDYFGKFDAFYCNPPFGQRNGGVSMKSFIRRGIESVRQRAIGCIVAGDHPKYEWTQEVLHECQSFMLSNHFVLCEMLPQFHNYHLDDAPDLTSCSMFFRRQSTEQKTPPSVALTQEEKRKFYGADAPLEYRFVRDRSDGGGFSSGDYLLETYSNE